MTLTADRSHILVEGTLTGYIVFGTGILTETNEAASSDSPPTQVQSCVVPDISEPL